MKYQQLTNDFSRPVHKSQCTTKSIRYKKTKQKPLNQLINNDFLELYTGKNELFAIFTTFSKSIVKNTLQAADNKRHNTGAVSIRLSRKAVKTSKYYHHIVLDNMYRYGLAERLLRQIHVSLKSKIILYRYGLAERLLRLIPSYRHA